MEFPGWDTTSAYLKAQNLTFIRFLILSLRLDENTLLIIPLLLNCVDNMSPICCLNTCVTKQVCSLRSFKESK